MKITVIGQGYVGLTVALFASKHINVVGFDLNEKLVSNLNLGKSHVEGISNEFIQSSINNERYHATSDPVEIDGSDVVVIAVPTPLNKLRMPDYKKLDRKSTRLNSSHIPLSRMPSSA